MFSRGYASSQERRCDFTRVPPSSPVLRGDTPEPAAEGASTARGLSECACSFIKVLVIELQGPNFCGVARHSSKAHRIPNFSAASLAFCVLPSFVEQEQSNVLGV